MEELAKAIVADNVNKTIEKLGSAAYQKIMFLKNLGIHIKRLRDDDLTIATELNKVDPFEEGSNRIKRLRRIHDEISYFFDEQAAKAKQKEIMGGSKITTKIITELCRWFVPSSNPLVSTFKIAGQVNAFMKELDSIDALYSSTANDSFGNQNQCTSSEDTSPFPDTNVLIGRDRDKENIVNMLCNSSNDQESHPVVAIVGVGGQGKTTLAQYVCQDDRVKSSFHQRLWVYVTPQSSINELLEKIITSATGEKPIYCVLEQLHQQVLQAIVGRKCLLVLDNVYYVDSLRVNVEALNAILNYGGFWGNGGKILITTRSKKAAALMGNPEPYELRDLAEDDCWTLLRYYAIKQEEEKECGLEEIGKDIAKMCAKVPLVLKIIGCHLAFKDNKTQWECFKNQLASNPTLYMSTQENKIERTLKLCYDLLDNNLKRCAAFCSIFPKGHKYNKNDMVRNWIALGFVESTEGMSLEDVGDAYVLELTQRGFFQGGGNFEVFKMHDVMHDLLQLVGKDKHQMIDSKTDKIIEGVRHVSLNMQDLNWEVLLSSISGKKTLESILLVSSAWENRVHGVPLGSRIDKLIPACQMVRVLEIYHQGIVKVPKSIGELTLVRHLNLSGNPFCNLPNEITKMVNLLTLDLSRCRELKRLPKEMGNLVDLLSLGLSGCWNLQELPKEMGKLVNLLSLDLSGCSNIEELPRDMGKLVKLRHLWVMGCRLRYMPKGIGNLTELETLDEFVVGKNSRSSRKSKANAQAGMEELGHLNKLKGDLTIKLAGRSKDIVSLDGEAHLWKKTKLTRLEIEFEKGAEEDEKFLEGIKLWGENWQVLQIMNYGGKRLPVWMTDDQFYKRFPKLNYFVLQRKSKYISPCDIDYNCQNVNGDAIRFSMRGNEDDLVEWVPRYSRIKEQLKMGTIYLSFTTRRRDGLTLTDDRDITLLNVYLGIKTELAPSCGSGGQHQPAFLLKSCIPNLTMLHLADIPELEVLPEEFRGLSSLRKLMIFNCQKLKVIPDWIDTLSSLELLRISKAPELKALPDSIGSLTSLRDLLLWDCPRLVLQPHQKSSLPKYCRLEFD